MQPYSDHKDTSEMPFSISDTALIFTLIFLYIFISCLAFELSRLPRRKNTDYEMAEVDDQPLRVGADRWLIVPAHGEPVPEYSAVDSSPPPPYIKDVDLSVFVVEVDE